MLNRKLSAYLNINKYAAIFARDDFSKIMGTELSKVLDEIVIDAIDTYSQDGKWQELLKSDDLNDEEYVALLTIYYTLEDNEKNRFVGLCYEKIVKSAEIVEITKHEALLKEIGEAPEFNKERAILFALEVMSYKLGKNGAVRFFELSKEEQIFLLKLMKLYSGIDDTGYLCNGFDAWRLNHNLDDSPKGPMGIDKALIESIREDILSGEHKLKEFEGCIPYVNKDNDYLKKVGQFREYITIQTEEAGIDYAEVKLDEIPGEDIIAAISICGENEDLLTETQIQFDDIPLRYRYKVTALCINHPNWV